MSPQQYTPYVWSGWAPRPSPGGVCVWNQVISTRNKILLQPPCPNLPFTSPASCFPLSYQEENAALAEAEDTSPSGTASCFLLKEPQTVNLSGLSQHLLSTSQ